MALPVILIEFLLNSSPFFPSKTASIFCFPEISLPGIDNDHSSFEILVEAQHSLLRAHLF